MASLASENSSPDGLDERALFEKAQAKLSEAFSLLQTLETELQKSEQRRQAQTSVHDKASVHDKHASERAELLAYVERVHTEALELAKKPLRPSREGREQVRRVTMRIQEVTRALQIELPVELTPAAKRLPRDTASNEDGMAAHLSRIAAAVDIIQPPPVPAELAEYYDDEVTPFLPMAKRETVLAEPVSHDALTNGRKRTPSAAPTREMPRAVGVSRKPQIRTVMFDPNDRNEEMEARVEENTAHLSRERAGAQMRREPRPTERDLSKRRAPTFWRTPQFAWTAASVCLVAAVVLLMLGLRG